MAGQKKRTTKKQRKKRKLILFGVEIVILVILIGGLFVVSKLNLIQRFDLDRNKIQTNTLSEETEQMMHGYTDIALFGLDNRDVDNYGHGNSDVIMICSINNDTKDIRMVSVYRDTYLDVSGANDSDPIFRKCNSAYARGGPEQSISMLNKNLDLDIDDYVTFDFSAVAKAIDILGGVTIDIDEAEAEWMPKYIRNTCEALNVECPSDYIISEPGKYNLNGIQAVAYSRIRYTKGNDYKRAERQRLVFSQMVKKAKAANIGKLNKLMDAVFPEISTSLSQTDMLNMVKLLLDYDLSDSRGFPFLRSSYRFGNTKGDCVIPCDLETNVRELHEYLYGDDSEYQPSDTVQKYNDIIVNETGYTVDSAIKDEFTESDDFTGSKDKENGTESTAQDKSADTEDTAE